jgi:uncharacterized membrane protein
VWVLAVEMSWLQTAVTILVVLGVGYGTLYKADDRDPDREADVSGVPLRYLSLVFVSYLSVIILAIAFDAPDTFLDDAARVPGTRKMALITIRAASVGSVFSVVGAATADSLF